MRFFNGIGLKSSITPQFLVLAQLDYGMQQRATGSGSASWYGGMLTGRFRTTPMAAVVGRFERYDDKDRVIIATGVADGFRSNGASIGLDVMPASRLSWRSELRGFRGEKAVFPKRAGSGSRSDALAVTSLALTF